MDADSCNKDSDSEPHQSHYPATNRNSHEMTGGKIARWQKTIHLKRFPARSRVPALKQLAPKFPKIPNNHT